MSNKTIFIIAIGAILVGAGAWYYYRTPGAITIDTSQLGTQMSSTTLRGPGYTIEQVAIEDFKTSLPNLDREIKFTASVPEEYRATVRKHVADDVAILKKDPVNAGAWLDLALWYHTANDYEGARDVWEFMVKAAPKDTTSYDNLGKLYHFDLKDFAKSEEYFKKSISINPQSTTPYTELFQLYTLSLKNETKAVAIIREAEKQFPAEPGFPYTLGAYYRDIGNSKAARAEFERALALARATGNMGLVGSIGEDLTKLP